MPSMAFLVTDYSDLLSPDISLTPRLVCDEKYEHVVPNTLRVDTA